MKRVLFFWKRLLEKMFPELNMVRLGQALVAEDQRLVKDFVELSEAPMGYQELSPQ